ncbi:MAG: C25 family cysteine peptidase, partial [bacterium]
VKDYHQNHGLIYLIMAGDYDNLGARIIPLEAGYYTDNTPCDLYFSDVVPYSSDWDANNNHQYGELSGDGCDWYCDVYVGRFPINTTTEATRWINKLLTYEQNPPSGYLTRSLQGGAGLWPSQNYYGDRVCDSIADNHLPSWWTHTKMYENQGVHSGFPDSLELGYGWCHIAGHGNKDGIYWDAGGSLIHSSDNIQNGMKLGVLHSIACQPGWFDNYECCAESYFNYANGGAIAIMLNARYGWGSPPNLGPSEWLDIWTAMEVFDNENWNIGIGHGLGKDHIIPGMDGYDHWSMTELNLFGDPEMQIYSREPVNMNVTNPGVINIGQGSMPVNVSSTRGPIEGAMCCLSRPGDTTAWFKATTNASGNATISYNITDPSPVYLTVYAHDHFYYLDTVNIASSGSYVTFTGINSINGGHNNSEINSGCSYQISVEVANFGNQNAGNVKGILTSNDPNISINQDTLLFGNVNANDTVASTNSCQFSIANGVEDNYSIPVTLTCFDQNDSNWTSNFSIIVNSPQLSIYTIGGPNEIHAGDNFYIWPRLENLGSGSGYNLDLTLRTTDNYVTVIDSTESGGSIQPGGLVWIGQDSAFNLQISAGCPEPHWVDVELEVLMDGGMQFVDTITFSIGQIAFMEDFESGGTGWTYSGSNCWHLTSRKYHSSNHSMFSGNESGNYSANLSEARAITPSLQVGPGDTMSFWHWYEIEDDGQGWDGCRIEISTDGGSSWNALYPLEGYDNNWYYNPADSIYTGNQTAWEQNHVVFDIQEEVKICWRFDTDGYVEFEGYYFDDVMVTGGTGFNSVEEEQQNPPVINSYQFSLQPVFPNPIASKAIIAYSVGAEGPVSLKVYDLTGREVTTLINQIQGPGNYRVEWDGRDSHGIMVSSGTYFYRMTSGSFSDGKKLVVVR